MGRTPFRNDGRHALSRLLFGSIVTAWAFFGGTATGAEYAELLRRGEEAREAGDLRRAIALFRDAMGQEPENPIAYIEAAEAYDAALDHWVQSYCSMNGRHLWSAPDDWRKHAEPPYRYSILGEPELPTEPNHDGTVPIEVLHQRDLAERAVHLAPNDSFAWRWLGEAYLILAEKAEAERCFRRAVELAPEDMTLRSRISRVYRAWKRPAEALPHLDEAVRLAPNEPEHRLFRSICRCELGDIAGATEDLKAFGISPEGAAELDRVTAISDSLTRNTQSFAFHSCYVRLRPNDARGYDARAMFLMKVKAYKKALKDIDTALSIQPSHPTFLYRRERALYFLDRHEEALQTAVRLCELRPYKPDVEALRALNLNELARHQEAQKSLQRVHWLEAWLKNRETIENSPDDAAAWLEGGRLALEGAEYEAAKTCFDKALSLHPDSPSVHDGLAQLHLALNQPKAALAAAERAVELDSKSTSYRATRAAARLQLGDLDGAIADYEAAGAFGSDIAEAYRRRAEQREQAGDAAGAAADRERAKALDPLGSAP